jgi:hypothetical protein
MERPADFFDLWLEVNTREIRKHRLVSLREVDGMRDEVLRELQGAVRKHYVASETMERRIAELGATETADLLHEGVPRSKRCRSGELGEILATEFVIRRLGYEVPVLRLRWKDGREMALRGDDLVAVYRERGRALIMLKGEAKSRTRLTQTVVDEAAEVLSKNYGRPSRYSVLFIADRLREQHLDEMASLFEKALLESFRGVEIEHLIFTLSGNAPESFLSSHLSGYQGRLRRYGVGLQINDHENFIQIVYEEL